MSTINVLGRYTVAISEDPRVIGTVTESCSVLISAEFLQDDLWTEDVAPYTDAPSSQTQTYELMSLQHFGKLEKPLVKRPSASYARFLLVSFMHCAL